MSELTSRLARIVTFLAARVGQRSAVQQALRAEGLVQG